MARCLARRRLAVDAGLSDSHHHALMYRDVTEPPSEVRYRCPCCRFLTLGERGGFEICPVCYWEDDGQDDHDADLVRGGPNGALSLTEARANFKTLGASEAAHRACVRLPRRTANASSSHDAGPSSARRETPDVVIAGCHHASIAIAGEHRALASCRRERAVQLAPSRLP
ncbi:MULTISPECIES: CPCC family cysteine-rich protein [unclassified Bradyrhizobium]|uniref:CPCC family cysteine-rich protein n=2 Tax=unclassified Bradyrhizobium TaxID=2631580 RepID=UPI0039672BB4